MKLQRISLISVGIAVLIMAGCNDPDPKPDPNPNPDEKEMGEMTPSESKQYLTETSIEFMDYYKPADQKEIIDLAAYYLDTYGDYDLPDEFYFEDEDPYGAPAQFMKEIGKAANGDVSALTRTSYYYSYTFNFDRMAGIYEPKRSYEQWVKTGDSKDIVFKFTDNNGKACEIKVTKSGSESKIEYESVYEDYYWNDKYIDTYSISIPQNIKATLKQGGKVLVAADVISSIDIKNHKFSVNSEATMCNMKAEMIAEGNDKRLKSETKYSIDGKEIATSSAVINGNDLCNIDKMEEMIDDDYDYDPLVRFLSTGEGSINVLGKVQLYASLDYNSRLGEDFDGWWCSCDDSSKSEARKKCQAACDNINECIKAYLCYDNTKTKQASIQAVPFYGEEYNHWYYEVWNQLLFPDGTTYDVDEYFGKFIKVSDKFETLLDAYERVWDNAF